MRYGLGRARAIPGRRLLVALALAGGLGAAAPVGAQQSPPTPVVRYDPKEANFGAVAIGHSRDYYAAITVHVDCTLPVWVAISATPPFGTAYPVNIDGGIRLLRPDLGPATIPLRFSARD